MARAWHAMELGAVLAELHSSPDGLSTPEATRRLAAVGPNELSSGADDTAWRILVRQLRSSLVVLLVAAAGIALATGAPLDAIAIAAVLVLNVAVGFATEYRAQQALEKLRELDAASAVVRRDAREHRIAAAELVPGDVVRLDAGAIVPADARLLEAADLATTEAVLTGESAPAWKETGTMPPEARVPDRHNMVYAGTLIARGAALAVVTGTADDTEFGRIGALMTRVADMPAPLERRLERLGRQLSIGALVATFAVAVALLLRGLRVSDVAELAIAIGVAAIPEGLPAVATIALAFGSLRMARRNARVRRLSAVESVGAMTAVCMDKTGTLTTGRMMLTTIERPFAASPEPGASEAARHIVRAGVLATPADPARLDAAALSDPTDAAFVDAARRLALLPELAADAARDAAIVPFDSSRMFCARIRLEETAGEARQLAYVKGAPSRVLPRCARACAPGVAIELTPRERERLEEQEALLALRGLRVLAVAHGVVRQPTEDALQGLTLDGFCGIEDPVAEGAGDAVAALRQAGVRVVMFTGDQRRTAEAVARRLGIDTRDVHARVLPEDKLEIVRALQQGGDIVGAVGDGVNDAPALRQADVGIALGARGTDVAKQAAELVLQDDRLETIRDAVRSGRNIFDNIRKSAAYLLGCNMSELLVLFVAAVAGLPPLLPLQLLWLNLVTDTFPALAIAVEPSGDAIMQRRPRPANAPIVDAALFRRALMHAVLMAIAAVAGALIARGSAVGLRTTVFAVMALSQTAHLFAARRASGRVTVATFANNRWATLAVALSVSLTVLPVQVKSVGRIVGLAPMDARHWGVAVALALGATVVGQVLLRVAPPHRRS